MWAGQVPVTHLVAGKRPPSLGGSTWQGCPSPGLGLTTSWTTGGGLGLAPATYAGCKCSFCSPPRVPSSELGRSVGRPSFVGHAATGEQAAVGGVLLREGSAWSLLFPAKLGRPTGRPLLASPKLCRRPLCPQSGQGVLHRLLLDAPPGGKPPRGRPPLVCLDPVSFTSSLGAGDHIVQRGEPNRFRLIVHSCSPASRTPRGCKGPARRRDANRRRPPQSRVHGQRHRKATVSSRERPRLFTHAVSQRGDLPAAW